MRITKVMCLETFLKMTSMTSEKIPCLVSSLKGINILEGSMKMELGNVTHCALKNC